MIGAKIFFQFFHPNKLRRCQIFATSLFEKWKYKSCGTNSKKQWKIVFYGTDEFSEDTLKVLHQNWLGPSQDRAVGSLEVICIKSDCPVKKFAMKNNIKLHLWPHKLQENIYDVGVVVSFGHMIPAESILACKYGIINAHPSLLPRWRGAAPIIHTILNGDSETGVTITQVSPNKFDVGNILTVDKYSIPPEMTSIELRGILSKKAANMVLATLKNLEHYHVSSYPQQMKGATKAPKIQPPNCFINWEQDTALNIYRKFKAFKGLFDLFTFWKDKRVDILECEKVEKVNAANISLLLGQLSTPPGFCYYHKKRKVIFVKCKNGWSGILSLRIPRTGEISAQDFYNGFISKEAPNTSYFLTKRCDSTVK